ncbi:amidohydrolase 2 [Mycena floridula]|nr:amidohydrolase 2 [Mycena floridula]
MKTISLLILLAAKSFARARLWNSNGTGTIILEEAWSIPELLSAVPVSPEVFPDLLDIHNQRLDHMNTNNVDFMVLSCATPCIQGISDPDAAAAMAINVNNKLADSISNNTLRFGAFASLAMHNATTAAQELNRTVNKLGFLGALLNDYQQSGPDNETLLYYDQPEYDVFWEMVTALDVPVYFHPRSNIAQLFNLEYQHARWLRGPAQEFSATLSTHILGLCTNGVFDRFPNLKVIVGHMGERIPSDLDRIDQQLKKQISAGMPMKANVTSYWQTNLFETTSADFVTDLLQFHVNRIGLDRILYSCRLSIGDPRGWSNLGRWTGRWRTLSR